MILQRVGSCLIVVTSQAIDWRRANFLVLAVMEMTGKEGKELFGKNTDRALADGAFGLPWFVATNGEGKTETFWGVDHLGHRSFGASIIWGK
jgi:hypothetical protein